MKIYLPQSVWDAALERVNWLFDEFDNIVVNISGGKDSTIVFNLALMVAEARGRLPLHVMFIDQEAEWNATIDHVRDTLSDPRVSPHWLQVPIRIFNATSPFDPWLHCWEPGAAWMREKEPDSIHDNTFGTDRFAEMFEAYTNALFDGAPCTSIAGVRAEESPARRLGLTTYEVYKGVTWGRVNNKKRLQYTFYPIYDWRVSDVWKAIHDNGWRYCRLYDALYQYGVAPRNMRVSNIHHETAVKDLFLLQEIEPDTWDRATARLQGINTAGQLKWSMFKPAELPPMFRDWLEYRDHLLDNLIIDSDIREKMRRRFASEDDNYRHNPKVFDDLVKTEIACILVNDYHGTKLSTFRAAKLGYSRNRGKKSGIKHD